MSQTFTSHSVNQTLQIAQQFTQTLQGGEVLILNGELGAGKTHFTKGIALWLEIKEIITSPTFVYFKKYQGIEKNLYHFDLYRTTNEEEVLMLGIEDIWGNKENVVVIEWGERFTNFPSGLKLIEININITNDFQRDIVITKKQ